MKYFRLILRCRQDARLRFSKMRSDVLVKLELLDQKHGKFNLLKLEFSFLHLKIIIISIFHQN